MRLTSLDGVSLRLGDRVVLRDVSFEALPQAMIAIMGPSGSGKTSLLHVLSGLVAPSSGTVTTRATRPNQIAWIVQNSPLLPRRTCVENIALGALARGASWDEAQVVAGELLRELGLAQVASIVGFRLSGGEKQRVAVARAIATDADLILADEPTASLDADSRALVCEALCRAADRGSGVVVTTHDDYVASIADDVFRLENGHLFGGRISRFAGL